MSSSCPSSPLPVSTEAETKNFDEMDSSTSLRLSKMDQDDSERVNEPAGDLDAGKASIDTSLTKESLSVTEESQQATDEAHTSEEHHPEAPTSPSEASVELGATGSNADTNEEQDDNDIDARELESPAIEEVKDESCKSAVAPGAEQVKTKQREFAILLEEARAMIMVSSRLEVGWKISARKTCSSRLPRRSLVSRYLIHLLKYTDMAALSVLHGPCASATVHIL